MNGAFQRALNADCVYRAVKCSLGFEPVGYRLIRAGLFRLFSAELVQVGHGYLCHPILRLQQAGDQQADRPRSHYQHTLRIGPHNFLAGVNCHGQRFAQRRLFQIGVLGEHDQLFRLQSQILGKTPGPDLSNKPQRGAAVAVALQTGPAVTAGHPWIAHHQIPLTQPAFRRCGADPAHEFMPHGFLQTLHKHPLPVDVQIGAADAAVQNPDQCLAASGSGRLGIDGAHVADAVKFYRFHPCLLPNRPASRRLQRRPAR